MTGIIDYNAGNIRSVEHALARVGIPHVCSKKPGDLAGTDRLIFPGVGDARYAMGQLKTTGHASFLRDASVAGIPILGICLGSQIVFDWSEEGDVECLGLIPGTVRHVARLWEEAGVAPLKAPHMGWNTVIPRSPPPGRLAGGAWDFVYGADYYFVHSYAICPADPAIVLGAADYGVPLPALIQSGSIIACQFHPEKSGEAGLRILQAFCGIGQIPHAETQRRRGEFG